MGTIMRNRSCNLV